MLKQAIGQITRDRAFLVVFIILFVLTAGCVVATSLQIHPSDLQLPTRYSSFGFTNFYRDKWHYLISFGFIGVVMMCMHIFIALRLYYQKSRQLGIAFMWLGVVLIITSYFTIFALFKVVSLSQ